uniref:Ribosomal RNA adenine dimethylase domain containing 1 n=1 Tax=Iconisemion striatum TaxID=60296 RepID=A0A1A7WEH6_9TELE
MVALPALAVNNPMSTELLATQNVEVFTSSFSSEQQKELANRLVAFLSQYSHLSDSFIIEFFSENLWDTLPKTWQTVLQDLSFPQIADLLLDASNNNRRYPSVWPLSLLAFRATAHALAFPRECRCDGGRAAEPKKPEEFLENHSQSSLLGHIFRKHVKPKKQHEIRKLGMLVKQICQQTGCRSVVDVGSGQGHLTRFLSFGLRLSVTAIEADPTLVAMASRFDGELLWVLEKENQKKKLRCEALPIPRHVAGWVNPRESWEVFIQQLKIPDHVSNDPTTRCCIVTQTSRRSRGGHSQNLNQNNAEEETSSGSCCSFNHSAHEKGVNPDESHLQRYNDFVLTGLHACGDLSATLLRHFVSCPHVRGITSVACCYMKITTKENPTPPGLVTPPDPLPSDPESFGYPMSCWVRGLPGHQLSYKAREGACHAVEDYVRRLREESELLRSHCYRAMLETFIRDTRPDIRRAGIQTIKKSHLLSFTEYARLGLARVGLPPDLPLDPERVAAMLKHQNKVVVYFSLSLLLAPVVETLVLLDRMIYLQENDVASRLVPLFNPNFSPRNFVLVALKPSR